MLAALSIGIRFPNSSTPQNYHNSDATWHTLLTMEAFGETPASIHRFLPIVSLGNETDKHIRWGAAIPDEYGNFYYTSFSSAGFVAPYIFTTIFNMQRTEQSLYIFNSLLLILSFLLTARLFMKLFNKYLSNMLIVILAALIYMFQPEIMHSQGIVYWHHSLFQFFLLLQLNFFINLRNKVCFTLFMVLCIIMPYIEWTGFVSNAAMAIGILFKKPDDLFQGKVTTTRKAKVITFVAVGLLSVLSFVIFFLHFLSAVDFDVFINALRSRFMARNITTQVSLLSLPMYYFKSFGALISIVAVGSVILLLSEARKNMVELIKEHWIIIFVFIFILVENVIMVQHAMLYSFARMKGVFILMYFAYALIAALLKVIEDKNISIRYSVLVVFLIFALMATFNVYHYTRPNNHYSWDVPYRITNAQIADEINSSFTHDNSILVSPVAIRGYTNLLFNRGINVRSAICSQLVHSAIQREQAYIVNLDLLLGQWNMNEIFGFTVYEVANGVIQQNDNGERLSPFFVTDNNWERGFSKHFPVFLMPNVTKNRERFTIGRTIYVADGDQREIVFAEERGVFLHVTVSGEILYPSDKKFPSDLEFASQIE